MPLYFTLDPINQLAELILQKIYSDQISDYRPYRINVAYFEAFWQLRLPQAQAKRHLAYLQPILSHFLFAGTQFVVHVFITLSIFVICCCHMLCGRQNKFLTGQGLSVLLEVMVVFISKKLNFITPYLFFVRSSLFSF